MSQSFRQVFDQMRNNDPTKTDLNVAQSFDSAGHVRNLCFSWPSGKMQFLNYAYLVSGTYEPEENTLTLTFTSDTVILKGSSLADLFKAIMDQIPRQIACVDQRYKSLQEEGSYTVLDILVRKNE